MQSIACLLIPIVICHCTEVSLCLFPLRETEVSYAIFEGVWSGCPARHFKGRPLAPPWKTYSVSVWKPNQHSTAWNSLSQQRAQLLILPGTQSSKCSSLEAQRGTALSQLSQAVNTAKDALRCRSKFQYLPSSCTQRQVATHRLKTGLRNTFYITLLWSSNFVSAPRTQQLDTTYKRATLKSSHFVHLSGTPWDVSGWELPPAQIHWT